MALTYRLVKGSPITYEEGDANLEHLDILPDTNTWVLPQRASSSINTTGTILMASSQHFSIEPTTKLTMTLPTDLAAAVNQTGVLTIDATTHTISWEDGWRFSGGVAPTLIGVCKIGYVVDANGITCGFPITDIAALYQQY